MIKFCDECFETGPNPFKIKVRVRKRNIVGEGCTGEIVGGGIAKEITTWKLILEVLDDYVPNFASSCGGLVLLSSLAILVPPLK